MKARLTAMAIETDEFRRDDIYTLFVTTRIINFLKGLRLPASTDMDALLDLSWSDDRTRIGFELLRLFRETNRLYFWTTKGLLENQKFKPEIFFRVLEQAGVDRLPKRPKNSRRRVLRFGSGGTTESADSCSYGLTAALRVFQASNLWNDWNGLNVWNVYPLRMFHSDGEHSLQVMPRIDPERN